MKGASRGSLAALCACASFRQIWLLPALAAAGVFTSHAPAASQVYVLVNQQGKSIVISGDKARAPEVFIVKEMREKGGAGWRVVLATEDKICWARRAVEGIFQPTKWVFETAATRQEAEKAARNAADALSARPDYGINTWEGSGCNRTSFPFKKLDMAVLEGRTRAPEPDTGIIDAVKGAIRKQVITPCEPERSSDGKSARASVRLPGEPRWLKMLPRPEKGPSHSDTKGPQPQRPCSDATPGGAWGVRG